MDEDNLLVGMKSKYRECTSNMIDHVILIIMVSTLHVRGIITAIRREIRQKRTKVDVTLQVPLHLTTRLIKKPYLKSVATITFE
jgi:hypothetical protein